MKKLFILVLLILTTSCTLFNQEEKFINPLFYKKMRTGSDHNPWDVEITPTTYYTENRHFPGEGFVYQCKLLKNTETEVVLRCYEPYDDERKQWLKENHSGLFDNKEGEYWTYVFEMRSLTEEEDPFNMFYIKKTEYHEDGTPYFSRGYSIDTPRK